MRLFTMFVLIALCALTLGCTPPMDRVFDDHAAQLDECLGYRLDADQKEVSANKVLRNALAGPTAKQDAQIVKANARTLRATHDACVQRLLEAATATAVGNGLTPEELRAAWPAWYDARAAARAD